MHVCLMSMCNELSLKRIIMVSGSSTDINWFPTVIFLNYDVEKVFAYQLSGVRCCLENI